MLSGNTLKLGCDCADISYGGARAARILPARQQRVAVRVKIRSDRLRIARQLRSKSIKGGGRYALDRAVKLRAARINDGNWSICAFRGKPRELVLHKLKSVHPAAR